VPKYASVGRSGSARGPAVKEKLMKQLILAAVAVLSLGVGSAFAQSLAHEAPSQSSGQGYHQ
jgi:hypothetical protein